MNEISQSTPPADDPSTAAVAVAKTAALTERSVDAGMRAVRKNPLGAVLAAMGLGLVAGSVAARRRAARQAARRAAFFQRPAEGLEAFLEGGGHGGRLVDRALGALRRLLHLT